MSDNQILIGVVGPCAAGKTSLIMGLIEYGFAAKQIAQEHSYVKDMWKRITNPTHLIYLDVSYEHTIKRKNLSWTYKEYLTQLERLSNARSNADLYIQTDDFSTRDILNKVLRFLEN